MQSANKLRGNISFLRKDNADHGLAITARAPVPGWLGERMELYRIRELFYFLGED
ncbi:hypothetical protein [Elongatibacter sediminis]|uniref:Uncharacterized protein n=1 Tax=Elongatibacter sediminis TaxID=3119006 RepID=A0AAW9RF56_9GAMM